MVSLSMFGRMGDEWAASCMSKLWKPMGLSRFGHGMHETPKGCLLAEQVLRKLQGSSHMHRLYMELGRGLEPSHTCTCIDYPPFMHVCRPREMHLSICINLPCTLIYVLQTLNLSMHVSSRSINFPMDLALNAMNVSSKFG